MVAGTDDKPIIYPALDMPENVSREAVTVWSLGLALDADIYRPKDIDADKKLPGVILSHGIGGDKLTSERYAAKFSSEGMIAISFSQASWGESHGRMTIIGDAPSPDEKGEMTVRVKMAREMMDPLEWVDCYRSVIDYLEAEPSVDSGRMGAWGTSFGGGTALYATSFDDRIKALAIQVPAVFNPPTEMVLLGKNRAKQIARGVTAPIPDGPPDAMPNLRGTPHFARMAQYKVGDRVDFVNVPTLIVDAGEEELFDIKESGGRAFRRLQDRGVESYYEIIPGIDHYGIYFDGYDRGSELALRWFKEHLSP